MTTLTVPHLQGSRASDNDGLALYRLSVQQYHTMIERGVLTDEDSCELLEGVLVNKMPIDEPHVFAAAAIAELLIGKLPKPHYSFRGQSPITLADGEPEPDGAVVLGELRRYVRENRKPGGADTVLVIEVANATLSRDRGAKLRSYARAGIPVYWIVNLIDRVVEVYGNPLPDAQPEPTYRDKQVFTSGQRVPLLIEGAVGGEIAVDDVLP